MSRLTRPVAWAMAAVALAASVVAAVVIAVAAGRGIPDAPNAWEGLPLVVGVGAPACVGLVLLLRRPGTRVAWILLAGALSVALVMAAYAVGSLALDDDPGSSPARGRSCSRRSGWCCSCGRSRSPISSLTGGCRRRAGASPPRSRSPRAPGRCCSSRCSPRSRGPKVT